MTIGLVEVVVAERRLIRVLVADCRFGNEFCFKIFNKISFNFLKKINSNKISMLF